MSQNGNYWRQPFSTAVHGALAVCRRLFAAFMANVVYLKRLIPVTIRSGCPLSHALPFLHGVYDSVVKSLAAHAIKPVTLGGPSHSGSTENSSLAANMSHDPNDLVAREGELSPVQGDAGVAHRSPNNEEENKKKKELSQVQGNGGAAHRSPNNKEENEQKTELSQVQHNASVAHHSSDIKEENEKKTELSQVQDDANVTHHSPYIEKENEIKTENELNVTVLPQERAPKKMVSINESIEVIKPNKKKAKKKKKKSTEKSPSMEEEEEQEEPKPLKSILKVPSNLKDNDTTS